MADGEKEAAVRIFEYTAAADPSTFMSTVPVRGMGKEVYDASGEKSGIFPLDLSRALDFPHPCSGPNLLVGFVRVEEGEKLETRAMATSQAFFVVRGAGESQFGESSVRWGKGDLFTVPFFGEKEGVVEHRCEDGADEGAAVLYWVSDEPLLRYLGVVPSVGRFPPAHYSWSRLVAEVERVRGDAEAKHRNRLGVLLGNAATEGNTKTLTHTLWALLNVLPPRTTQPAHRHNSIALDLAIDAPADGTVYTIMGPEIDDSGEIIDPIKCTWTSGAMFVTPPGWWHSHVNEGEHEAFVLPLQDAGLHTAMRTLDIRFAKGIVEEKKGD